MGGVSPQPPRLLCHQMSRPMAGRMGKAGSLSRGGGDGRDQSPRSRPEERSLDVLWSLRGRETQLSWRKRLPHWIPAPPSPAWGLSGTACGPERTEARPGLGARGWNCPSAQPGCKVGGWRPRQHRRPGGGRGAFSRSGPRRREAVGLISPVRCSVSPDASAGPHYRVTEPQRHPVSCHPLRCRASHWTLAPLR